MEHIGWKVLNIYIEKQKQQQTGSVERDVQLNSSP